MVKRLRVRAVERSSTELNKILVQVLEENGVEPWSYSLEGFRDERQCMEPDGKNWVVYYGERGRKRRCKTFPVQKEAAQELVERLGRTEEQRAGLQASMERLWQPIKVVPYIVKESSYTAKAAVLPDVASPVAIIPVNENNARKEMKLAMAKMRCAMLRADHPYSRSTKKAARRAAKRMLANKLKQKEKEEKLKTQIHTFGLKG